MSEDEAIPLDGGRGTSGVDELSRGETKTDYSQSIMEGLWWVKEVLRDLQDQVAMGGGSEGEGRDEAEDRQVGVKGVIGSNLEWGCDKSSHREGGRRVGGRCRRNWGRECSKT